MAERASAGERMIEAAKEAVAIAKGVQPAARIHVNGHAYVPEAEVIALRQQLSASQAREAEAYERAAKKVEHRLKLLPTYAPAAANAVLEALPDAIRALTGEVDDAR